MTPLELVGSHVDRALASWAIMSARDQGARPRGKLADAVIDAFLEAHAGWTRDGDAIARTYTFADYPAGLAFVVRVGFAAEKRDHHPDLFVGWAKVRVVWSTHDAGGVTALDLDMAERTDQLHAPS
jgi:4a-hydroxytetrahydrobiopterin dehydratase